MPEIIQFQSQYTEEVKSLVDIVLKDLGIDADTIQLYKENDLDHINEVYKDRGRFWIALEGDRVIGTIAIIGSDTDKDVARLRRMFVLPEFHGKGVGQQLFDTAINFVKEKGYKKVILNTDKVMARAHKFYEKNGFNKVGEDETRLFYERSL